MTTCAIVVGSNGQDGTLLSAQLAARGTRVHGIAKPERDVERIVAETNPDEVYYLAAFHHSSQDPPIDPATLLAQSTEVHVTNLARWLDAIRARSTRLFYAASSLLFGDPVETPQTERTPMNPTEAYGVTKLAGMTLCHEYRTKGVFASVGILYNHESPLRQAKFVSKKIVKAAWAIKRGEQTKLVLGSLDAALDWGYAPDFVDAMQRVLALPAADDFIVATGELHSVRDFVELAFGQVGLDWRAHVEENPAVITRPPLARVGDASKLRAATGWKPSTSFPEMVRLLMDAEGHG